MVPLAVLVRMSVFPRADRGLLAGPAMGVDFAGGVVQPSWDVRRRYGLRPAGVGTRNNGWGASRVTKCGAVLGSRSEGGRWQVEEGFCQTSLADRRPVERRGTGRAGWKGPRPLGAW